MGDRDWSTATPPTGGEDEIASLRARLEACERERDAMQREFDAPDDGPMARAIAGTLYRQCVVSRDAAIVRAEAAERERDALVRPGTCAKSGKRKPLPYRRDDLDGYVCLTCMETYLDAALARAEAAEARIDIAHREGWQAGAEAMRRDAQAKLTERAGAHTALPPDPERLVDELRASLDGKTLNNTRASEAFDCAAELFLLPLPDDGGEG